MTALPQPNTNRPNIAAGDILCVLPLPHTKVTTFDLPDFPTDDGVTHRARSAIYTTSGFPNVQAGGTVTQYSYSTFGVVASSSSYPVTIKLTGTAYDALGDNTPEVLRTGTKNSYNQQTCLWEADGPLVSSATGVRMYITGVHNINSGGHTLETNTSGGLIAEQDFLVPTTFSD